MSLGVGVTFYEVIDEIYRLLPSAIKHSMHSLNLNGTHIDSNDICHDIIILLMKEDGKYLKTFKGKSSLKTWVHTIVRNYLVRSIKQNGRYVELNDINAGLLIIEPEQEQKIWDKQKDNILMTTIESLSDESKKILDLSCTGISDQEIARKLGIKVSTIRTRRFRVITHLRESLSPNLK